MLTKKLIGLTLTLVAVSVWTLQPADGMSLQGNFTIYGRVSLPDGRPAPRVKVRLDSFGGFNREVQSDDQGAYEFRSIPGGRYQLTVINPNDPSQYIDPVTADTGVSRNPRILVHLFLHAAPPKKASKAGVTSVAEATQNIPKNAQKAFKQGIKYKTDNKLDQALESFSDAIKFYPEYFQALAERGEVKIKRGQLTEALADFEDALKLSKDYEPALRGLGFCKMQQQEFAEAARYLERATAANPDSVTAYLYLGMANFMMGQGESAKQAFERALRINAEQATTAHRFLSELYAREQRYKEAADELQAYLAAVPTAPNADKLKATEAEYRTRAKAAKN